MWSTAKAANTYTFQEGVNGYAGTQDTEIRGGTPDRDDGDLPELSIDASDGGGQNHVLIRFENMFGSGANQIPSGASILQVSLRLWITSDGNPPNLHKMLKPWTEAITWNTFDEVNLDGIQPDGIEAAEAVDGSFEAPNGEPYFVDVELDPQTVKDWLDGKSPNHGWAILPTGGNGVDFDTSENGSLSTRPKLTIITGQPGETLVTSFTGTALGFTATIKDGTFANGQANAVNSSTVKASLDGTDVPVTATKDGDITTVTHAGTRILASESAHAVTLTYSDSATPPTAVSSEHSFTVPAYPTVPGDFAVTGVDTTKPGFKARVHQLPLRRPGGDRNNLWAAERQLSNQLIDVDTGEPFTNDADLFAAQNGIFTVDGTINWNQDAPSGVGNFRDTSTPPMEDQPIPGIPGIGGLNDDIAAEITGFLDLKAGFYRFGVNSDDGFRVSTGPSPHDPYAFTLGFFDGGRGSADTLFDFAVEKDGFYPFRLSWWEGSGGANLEFFVVDLGTGEKILINDTTSAKSVKAYREGPSVFGPREGLQMLITIDDKHQWRLDDSSTDLGTAWREKGFNDSAWIQGPALLGYESNVTQPIRTDAARPVDPSLTHYYRTRFNFTGDPAAVELRLLHIVDDGAIFYLNGTEVHRYSMPTGDVKFSTAAISHENQYEGPFVISNASLVQGENVIAVEVHQTDAGSSDSVMGVELFAAPAPKTTPPANLQTSISRSGANVSITWTAGKLQQADAVSGPWTDVPNATSPLTVAPTGTKFYRASQ